ncbi:vWA domain-containing protein [Bacillus chungangensis]|uniref:Nitric oxide reductase activation protein n=1 Tax=Bacillus chungangensis TaxID=587633 RepID=A0ABT9WVZ3_9BACI|nr:hypothetical protein [Bacillus chungangensis]MDQ0177476.1 nitric oxide reductase activation protein [Bacillus chungangensis]
MRRFIQFNDEQVDASLYMELTDLTKTLAADQDYQIQFGAHSYLDSHSKVVYISHFWQHRPEEQCKNGMKSDVFLRVIGNANYTEEAIVADYHKYIKKTTIQSFAKQLMMMAEDLRLEEICKRERPGTKRVFQQRRFMLRRYFSTQLQVNLEQSRFSDALFNVCYLLLTAASPIISLPFLNESISFAMPIIRQQLSAFYETTNTRATSDQCLALIDVLQEVLDADMLQTYFHLPVLIGHGENGLAFTDLKRKDPLQNRDIAKEEEERGAERLAEKMDMWHRETKEIGRTFFSFDLEKGTQTRLGSDGGREEDEGDPTLLSIAKGSNRRSVRNDYDEIEEAALHRNIVKSGHDKYGFANRFASSIFLTPAHPTSEEMDTYRTYKQKIATHLKKLVNMIQKTLEQKQTGPRKNVHYGSLDQKLVRYFTEEYPRLFYKKNAPAPELDAVFMLLVDCSASMADKMEQTKLGIVLFHEALRLLRIQHEIVGFWEDTSSSTTEKQPNYFFPVVSNVNCFHKKQGAAIMQLKPEEDNRDGYAIRKVTENLKARYEKQKFLLIFSDGEPAAFHYDQNGIVDTHEAVLNARKQGIIVMNVFLSNGTIEERQKRTIENIYGKYSVPVSNIDELPDILYPLLKKLIGQILK